MPRARNSGKRFPPRISSKLRLKLEHKKIRINLFGFLLIVLGIIFALISCYIDLNLEFVGGFLFGIGLCRLN